MKKVIMGNIDVQAVSVTSPPAQELNLVVRVSCCSGRRCGTMPERVACVPTKDTCSGETQVQAHKEGLVRGSTAIGAREERGIWGLGIDRVEILKSTNGTSGSVRGGCNKK